MSGAQFHQTVAQWSELERAGHEEAEWRRLEDGNLALQEARAARDEEDEKYMRELESKYPILRSW